MMPEMIQVKAGSLTLAYVGRLVRVRTPEISVTGTLTSVWFRRGYGDKPNSVSVNIEFRGGKASPELRALDVIEVLDE